MNPRIVTHALTGNPLAALVTAGNPPADWYQRAPSGTASWRERVESVRSGFQPDWLSRLEPAFEATGNAKTRLDASSNGRGVVVTTGQQPGLFGGPVYTLSKALSALALADRLQEVTGVPVAPVFWAATDDTDFKEASSTVVSLPGGPQLLRIEHTELLGRTMASMPLGDVSAQLEALASELAPDLAVARACGCVAGGHRAGGECALPCGGSFRRTRDRDRPAGGRGYLRYMCIVGAAGSSAPSRQD